MCERIQEHEPFDTRSWRPLQAALRAAQHARREVADEPLHFNLDHAQGRVFATAVLDAQLVPTPLVSAPPAGSKQRCEVAVEGVGEPLLLIAECVGIETPDGVLLALEPASPRQRHRLESLASGRVTESRPASRDELPTITETELHGAIRRKLAEVQSNAPWLTPVTLPPPPSTDDPVLTDLRRDDSLPETMPPPPFRREDASRPAAITMPPPPSGGGFVELPFVAHPRPAWLEELIDPPLEAPATPSPESAVGPAGSPAASDTSRGEGAAPRRALPRPLPRKRAHASAAYVKTQELPDLVFANPPVGSRPQPGDVALGKPSSPPQTAPPKAAPPKATLKAWSAAPPPAAKRTPTVALEARLLRPVVLLAATLLLAVVAVATFTALQPTPTVAQPGLPTANR